MRYDLPKFSDFLDLFAHDQDPSTLDQHVSACEQDPFARDQYASACDQDLSAHDLFPSARDRFHRGFWFDTSTSHKLPSTF